MKGEKESILLALAVTDILLAPPFTACDRSSIPILELVLLLMSLMSARETCALVCW